MKKFTFAVILVISLLLTMVSLADLPDISSLTNEELVELRNQIDSKISKFTGEDHVILSEYTNYHIPVIRKESDENHDYLRDYIGLNLYDLWRQLGTDLRYDFQSYHNVAFMSYIDVDGNGIPEDTEELKNWIVVAQNPEANVALIYNEDSTDEIYVTLYIKKYK